MSGQDPDERRFDLELKRDTYALTKDQRIDKDERVMRWITFVSPLIIFAVALFGTFRGWAFANYLLGGIIGHLVRFPRPPDRRSTT